MEGRGGITLRPCLFRAMERRYLLFVNKVSKPIQIEPKAHGN